MDRRNLSVAFAAGERLCVGDRGLGTGREFFKLKCHRSFLLRKSFGRPAGLEVVERIVCQSWFWRYNGRSFAEQKATIRAEAVRNCGHAYEPFAQRRALTDCRLT